MTTCKAWNWKYLKSEFTVPENVRYVFGLMEQEEYVLVR